MSLEPQSGGKNEPVEVSDETLIKRFNRGDRVALDTLVKRYTKPLYNFLWRMTECESDSDEIFQDTWIRVIQKSRAFRQERFKGWLFKIAHNLVIDWSRRQRKLVSLDAPTPGSESGGPTWGDKLVSRDLRPDEQANGHETGRAIRKALARLPWEQRAVFVMRMESGMAFKDIARAQKVSLNTVLARMQYALGKMRIMLKHYQHDGETIR